MAQPCVLCRRRPAKRACPALRQEICATCCATQRLVQIACTPDCTFLQSSQKHPAAVVKRQIDRDVTALMATLGRVSEQQLQLFLLIQSVIVGHKPDGLIRLLDEDVALATGALAKSLETASKGVIYEEATASVPAEALRRELKTLIAEVTKDGGSRAEREVAVVLRGIERGARHEGGAIGDGPTPYLELVGRIMASSNLSNPRNPPNPPNLIR